METPYEDADEQAHEVPEADEEESPQPPQLPFEVNEADAAEQIRDAGYDDEDYR
jgi:hypothetical protein